MNQVTSMFMESNKRMRDIMKGEFKQDQVLAAQREFEGQIKLINTIVLAYGIASKNKRALTGLEKMNIMDDSTAVDLLLGDKEEDKVRCVLEDKLIARGECVDYSGSHLDDCRGCETGEESKRLLLPPKE